MPLQPKEHGNGTHRRTPAGHKGVRPGTYSKGYTPRTQRKVRGGARVAKQPTAASGAATQGPTAPTGPAPPLPVAVGSLEADIDEFWRTVDAKDAGSLAYKDLVQAFQDGLVDIPGTCLVLSCEGLCPSLGVCMKKQHTPCVERTPSRAKPM